MWGKEDTEYLLLGSFDIHIPGRSLELNARNFRSFGAFKSNTLWRAHSRARGRQTCFRKKGYDRDGISWLYQLVDCNLVKLALKFVWNRMFRKRSLLSCGWPNDCVSNMQLDVPSDMVTNNEMKWEFHGSDILYNYRTRLRRCISGYFKERRRHGIQITLTLDTVNNFKCSLQITIRARWGREDVPVGTAKIRLIRDGTVWSKPHITTFHGYKNVREGTRSRRAW